MRDQVTTRRFIGRAEELALLRELLARAVAGEPQVALIGGEAGVGKTRLVGRLAASADEQGVRVLRGGCVPLGGEGLPVVRTRAGCSNCCWAWSSGRPRARRCCWSWRTCTGRTAPPAT